MLAYDDRTRVIADEHRPLVTTKNLRVRATFLVGRLRRAGRGRSPSSARVATLRVGAVRGAAEARAVEQLTAEGEALLRFAEPEAKDYDVQFGEPG